MFAFKYLLFPVTFSLYDMYNDKYFGLTFCVFASWAYIGKLLLDQGYDLGVFGSDYMRLGIFSNIWKVFLINSKNHFLNLKTHFKWFLSYNLIDIYFSNFLLCKSIKMNTVKIVSLYLYPNISQFFINDIWFKVI